MIPNITCPECFADNAMECRPEEGQSVCGVCGLALGPDELRARGEAALRDAAELERGAA
jgi:transcription initiation factor TFIIIB Brf1 subunit/transcription initiation factor TFIIB